MVKHDLERITGTRIPLSMFTDSKSLFDTMVKNTVLTEKRLMIDLRVAREAYNLNEISDIGFIRGNANPADCFTKVGHNDALTRIVFDGLCDLAVEQWVIREPKHSDNSESERRVSVDRKAVGPRARVVVSIIPLAVSIHLY